MRGPTATEQDDSRSQGLPFQCVAQRRLRKLRHSPPTPKIPPNFRLLCEPGANLFVYELLLTFFILTRTTTTCPLGDAREASWIKISVSASNEELAKKGSPREKGESLLDENEPNDFFSTPV